MKPGPTMRPGSRSQVASILVAIISSCFICLLPSVSATEQSCLGSGQARGVYVAVGISGDQPSIAIHSAFAATSASTSTSGATTLYVQYRWVSVCGGAGPTAAAGKSADCGQANTCPDPADRV